MNEVAHVSYGAPMAGGFYAGRILIASIPYALIVAPKASGEHPDIAWNRSDKNVADALSFNDGLANTEAMAKAGSALAKWALGLVIEGISGWYIGAQDELEIAYRNLKPGTEQNSQWGRSGINVSAIPPTYPYAVDLPAQTPNDPFRTGGAEAFDEVVYWSSSQHASGSDYAWFQDFHNGVQSYWGEGFKFRARAVRRLPI